MIRSFRLKIIGKRAEFGHHIPGWKAEEKVAKYKNKEVWNGTVKKHPKIAKALPLSSDVVRVRVVSRKLINQWKKGIALNWGVRDGVVSRMSFLIWAKFSKGTRSRRGPWQVNRPTFYFWTVNSWIVSYCTLHFLKKRDSKLRMIFVLHSKVFLLLIHLCKDLWF